MVEATSFKMLYVASYLFLFTKSASLNHFTYAYTNKTGFSDLDMCLQEKCNIWYLTLKET